MKLLLFAVSVELKRRISLATKPQLTAYDVNVDAFERGMTVETIMTISLTAILFPRIVSISCSFVHLLVQHRALD